MSFLALFGLVLIASARGDPEDLCLTVNGGSGKLYEISEEGVNLHIRGRKGQVGPPGLKGEPGVSNGQCDCDPMEMEDLRKQIQKLQGASLGRCDRKGPGQGGGGGLTNGVMGGNFYIQGPIAWCSMPQLAGDAPEQDANSYCSVGMRERRVRDEQITASSMWDPKHAPTEARLDNQLSSGTGWGRGAWSAGQNRVGEWIQVDLKRPTYLTKIITQGRPAAYDQWVTSYKLSSGNSTDQLQVIRDESGIEIVFQGNRDRNSYVINQFPQPVTARYVRILPITWHNHISLRLELLTC